MWLTLGQTQLIHKLMFFTDLLIQNIVFIFVNFVLIEMREKLHSQRETVISLSKLWDSRQNRETWQVWIGPYTNFKQWWNL